MSDDEILTDEDIIYPKKDIVCQWCKCDCDMLIRCEDGIDRCVECAADYNVKQCEGKPTTPVYWCKSCGVEIYCVQIPIFCPECNSKKGFVPSSSRAMIMMPEDF